MSFPSMVSAGQTHTGLVRKGNEDAMLVVPEAGVFAVADGMGGVAGGAFASSNLLESIESAARRMDPSSALDVRIARLRDAVGVSNQAIRAWAENEGVSGAGTTLILLTFNPRRPEFAALLHAGDSRAYLLREGKLQQLTRDHSAAESFGDGTEASVPALFRNVVTNAIGMNAEVELDETLASLRGGDTVLLCSDGLYRMVPEAEMISLLSAPRDLSARAQDLIDAANRNGGRDNITAVLVHIAHPAGETRGGTTESETHDTDMRSALEAARQARDAGKPLTRSLTGEFASPPVAAATPVVRSKTRWLSVAVPVVLIALATAVLLFVRPSRDVQPPVVAGEVERVSPPVVVEPPPVPVAILVARGLEAGEWGFPPERLLGYAATEGQPSVEVIRAWMDVWRVSQQDGPQALEEVKAFRDAAESIVRVWNPVFTAPPVPAWPAESAAIAGTLCRYRAELQRAFFSELDAYVSTVALVLGAFGNDPAGCDARLRAAAGRTEAQAAGLPERIDHLRNLVRGLNRWKERTRAYPVGLPEMRNLTATFLEAVEDETRRLFEVVAADIAAIPARPGLAEAREELRDFYAARDAFTEAVEDHAHFNGLEREALAARMREILHSPGLKDIAEARVAAGGGAP